MNLGPQYLPLKIKPDKVEFGRSVPELKSNKLQSNWILNKNLVSDDFVPWNCAGIEKRQYINCFMVLD